MKPSTREEERLERELLEALRAHKRELVEHFGHEDKIPPHLDKTIEDARNLALARFQSTAKAMRQLQKFESEGLPDTLYNVGRDHFIFSKGKNGKGPFEVKVVKTKRARG